MCPRRRARSYVSFFFLMLPRPPRSTLFPYTTLFLSGYYKMHTQVQLLEARRHRLKPDRQGRADRKSTRLNSSHANISYAVFCLKKKKTTRRVERSTKATCYRRSTTPRPRPLDSDR